MSEKYAPGTVATATVRGVPNVRVFRNVGGWWSQGEPAGGSLDYAPNMAFDKDVTDIRPLVTLDPEDEATIDRVADAIRDHHGRSRTGVWTGIDWLCTQEAVRSLAKPPKPEEPTGLGAVIEDAEGVRWLRHTGSIAPWHRHDGQPNDRSWCYFTDIDAVKVLSEGVQS